MSDHNGRPAGKEKGFGDLDAGGKIAFIGKVLVFIATFGFAFPTIFSD